MPDSFDSLKTALADRYAIEREIGAGGMAAVLGPERFLREIETTANLNHPHILPLFDWGEADGYLHVMPMTEITRER